eukprot:TRINITY_DN25795_c0_g1_i3.p1 TRINITY_DN25795_c0_g1~~TRINITY_DN25795_c0_g1_i3.p1  ORF type:complete len:406 (-),score=55.83 TRINITY_DN25795_c0_g1_i3:812-2029(-)
MACTRACPYTRHLLCETTRELLLSRAGVTVLGWLIKEAIVLSCKSLISHTTAPRRPHQQTDFAVQTPLDAEERPKVVEILIRVGIFLILLFGSTVIVRLLGTAESDRLSRARFTYAKGARLIPAWAWKDVVVCMVHAAWLDVSVKFVPLLANCVKALLVAVGSAASQLALETWLEDGREGAFTHEALKQLSTSMWLGTGWAVNNVISSLFADCWDELWFQIPYTTVATVLLHLLQRQCNAHIEQRGAAMRPLVRRTLVFFSRSMDFVIAWAWLALLHIVFKPLGDYVLIAWAVSLLAIALVAGSECLSVSEGKKRLCMTTAALNITWVWMDVAAEIKLPPFEHLIKLWLNTFLWMIYVILGGLFGEVLLYLVDPGDPGVKCGMSDISSVASSASSGSESENSSDI